MKNLNKMGMVILIVLFILFYFITSFFLEKRNISKNTVDNTEQSVIVDDSHDKEKAIVNNLYKDVRILYDVVNNKFRVDQDDTVTIGDIVYKKIVNFDEVMNPIFTDNGVKKYVSDLGNYFVYLNGNYYLAGNLVSYQTFYFRGDNTNIYITDVSEVISRLSSVVNDIKSKSVFKVETDEIDFDDIYQITIKIDKRDF